MDEGLCYIAHGECVRERMDTGVCWTSYGVRVGVNGWGACVLVKCVWE